MSDEWQVPGFTQIRELGRGGGGRVVQATDDAGTPVAIKYLSGELLADDGFRTAFRTEAELLAGLDTPHVTRLFEYVESSRGAAIVMELVDGTSLRTTLVEHGPTEPESALSVLKGSLLGLGTAHRAGVVHRDYKPENVLVTPEGESKLVDFGIAARSGGAGDGAGTPAYMPPEQWAGGSATTQGDIYAATATFVEALTGSPPFLAEDFVTLRDLHEHAPVPVDGLPQPVHELALRGLAKDPADRPFDAQDFLVHLEHAAVTGYGPDWEERGRDSLARRAALLALLSAEAVAAAGSTAVASSTLGRLGRASRRPATVAAVGLVLAAGLAAVAVTSVPRTAVPSVGQTTLPQRVAVQPAELPSAPPAGSAPAGPPNGGKPAVSPPARGEPAGEAGGGGAPPRVVVLPPPPAEVYRPRPPDVYIGPDHGGRPGGRDDDGPRRRPGGDIDRPGDGGTKPPPVSDGGTGAPSEPQPPHIPTYPIPPYVPDGNTDTPSHPNPPSVPDPKPPSVPDPKPPHVPDGSTDTPTDPKPPRIPDGGDTKKTDPGSTTLPHYPGGKDTKKTDPGSTTLPHYPRGEGDKSDDGGSEHPRHPRGDGGRGPHPGRDHTDSSSKDSGSSSKDSGSSSKDSGSSSKDSGSSSKDSGSSSKDSGDSKSHDSSGNGSDNSGPVVK